MAPIPTVAAAAAFALDCVSCYLLGRREEVTTTTIEEPATDTAFPNPDNTTTTTSTTTSANAGGSSGGVGFSMSHTAPKTNLSVWAYVAIAFVVLAVGAVMVYAIYGCCRSDVVRVEGLEKKRRSTGSGGEKDTGKKKWWKFGNGMKFVRECRVNVLQLKGSTAVVCGRRNGEKREVTRPISVVLNTRQEIVQQGEETERQTVPSLKFPPGLTEAPGTSGESSTEKTLVVPSIDIEGRKSSSTSRSGPTGFDTFNIPFAMPRHTGSMKQLWADPKLSPIRGAIIRPGL